MNQNKLEILEANYWEHFKFAKDLSLFYSINHSKRKVLEDEMCKLLIEINKLKDDEKIKN